MVNWEKLGKWLDEPILLYEFRTQTKVPNNVLSELAQQKMDLLEEENKILKKKLDLLNQNVITLKSK